MVAVDVGIGKNVDELVWLELDLTGHQMQEQRVLGHVEGHTEDEVAGALVHHEREPSTGHEKLKKRVTSRQRHLLELAGVPRDHEHSPTRGLLADEADRLAQLVDVAAVWCDPVAPLLSIVASGVAGKTGARLPVVGERVPVPDADTEGVEVVHV